MTQLVGSKKIGTSLIQLTRTDCCTSYFLSHRQHGQLLLYEYVADNPGDAISKYNAYVEEIDKLFGEHPKRKFPN